MARYRALAAAAAWPLAARAQQSERMRRIGVLMGYAESDSDARAWYATFREALQKLERRDPMPLCGYRFAGCCARAASSQATATLPG